MKGYVAKKGDRWYAVIYEGLDPVTGKELQKWHPAGTSREEAERLAARLACPSVPDTSVGLQDGFRSVREGLATGQGNTEDPSRARVFFVAGAGFEPATFGL